MASLPTNLCELFAQSVRQYPENLAVEHEDGSFTYRELDGISSALAHDLTLLRVGRGSPVLLVTTHGSFNIIAILAILKAGGCFVPIDRKAWSPEMISYVCDAVESHIIINTTPEPFSAAKGSHHVLHLTSLPPISSSQISPSVYSQKLEDDACIIFTSGSTGCPKGVILSHKSLCLYSTTSLMNLDIVPGDRLLHILSVAFDACACMLFSTLGNGGTVIPTQAEDIYAKAPSCTIVAATPSILSTLMESSSDTSIFSHVHTVILGGETAKQELLGSLLDAGIRVLIGYGATETTSMGSIHIVTRDLETNTINPQLIGASIKQSPIHLVNSDHQLIEDDFTEGEIFIAGDGLSRGYYKDDEKTNNNFIYWNSRRVYKTGDYGRWIPNPKGGRLIEFRGRKDRTVKNGGFLVNLDRDVENALNHVGMSLGVTSVCAAVTEDGIVAVVTPGSIDIVALLAKARDSMSTYCIPYRIQAVESFPMSSNGKIQHRKVLEVISAMDGKMGSNKPVAMPLPPASQQADPKTMVEEERLSKILGAASSLFGLSGDGSKRIQESDSFLKLGGSSLLAFKLASTLRQLNLNISPKDLFSGHTFQEIAKYSSSITIAEEGSLLSPSDERFDVTQKLASLRSQARSILALENDSFDIGCGAQIVHKRPMRKPKLQFFDNSADYEEAVQKADINVGLGCSLEFIVYHPTAVPGAATAVIMPKEIKELTVVLTAHHSLMDGLSLQILLANVEHAARGRKIPCNPNSIEAYLKLISIQQKQDASARSFFSEHLRKLRLAHNLPKKPEISIGGNMSLTSPNSSILFGPSVGSDEVAHFASKICVSPACIYCTAWAMAMSTFEGDSTIVMGSVFSNRASHPEFHDVIGLYMSTLPLVVSIDANETVYHLLHKTMGDILSLGGYAWARSDQVGVGKNMSSLVALQPPLPDENSYPPAIRAESLENSEFPLSLLIESNGEFRILYNSGVLDEGAIRRLGGHFKQALRGVLNHTLVGECMKLNNIQETAYLQAENARIKQSEQTVKMALEESIDRFQDYIAIEDCKGNTLTYKQLEQQTNIIANIINEHLSDTTATSVAIYGDGSVGWLLGLLGILKTSRTFVPLDPKWSMERKAMVLEASKAAAIVVPNSAQQNEVPILSEKKALAIDHMLSVVGSDERAARLPDTGHADSVFVYIFTSGTTGAPKVTMTPAVLSVLDPEHYPNLEIIYATGEAITAPIVEKFATKKLLYNAYGPAECSISTSFERMIQGDVITIGKASATARMYLLDEEQNPVPKGVQGEICLAGVQVLERYINAPDQTALRVLPDPWHPKERMYRTGDYGICVKDGRVIYMGRIDRQVKIRGFRIELDGVEHAILSEPGVDDISQCAVLAIDGVLVAYITFGSKQSQNPTQERIDRLRNRMVETQLPSWVPQQIIAITDFPKSFHHDETLLGPSISTDDSGVESKLSEAWCETLQLIPHVGTTVTAFNIANILTVSGQLDYTMLVDSFTKALASDPVLSCNFVEGPDGLRRVVRISAPQVREVEQLDVASEINYAFNLEHDELIRVHIIRQPEELGPKEKASMVEIVITTSHSIADLATLQNLLRLVSTAYAGKPIQAYKEPQHLSSSRWQYTPTTLEQNFWRDYLRKDDAESSKSPQFKIPLLPSVTATFQRLGITHHHMALTVAALLLQWLMNEDDIVLGAPNANRCASIEREALGQFLDRLPIRIELGRPRSTSDGPSLTKILTNTRDSAIKALANAIPFSKILEALNISSGGLQHPIFDCMVTFHLRHNTLDKWLQLPDCDVTASPRFAEGAKFPLMLEWFEKDADCWSLHIEHDTNRLPHTIIDLIEHVLETILEAIADECLLLDLHTRLADATEASRISMDHDGTSVSTGDPPRVPGLGLLLPFSEQMANETKLPIWKIAAQEEEHIWYLGYGSNMKASSMKGRNITPLATRIVNVPTHYVTFDVFGIPYSEPCYASIEEFPNGGMGKRQLLHGDTQIPVPSLCGIAHLLTAVEFHQLLVTEGSGVVYDIVKLQAYQLDEAHKASGESFAVYTLKAKWPLRPNGTPSARYVNLFLHGARENNLPPEYIKYLESFPRYLKLEGSDRTYGQLVFDAGWRPFLKRMVRLTTWRVDDDGNCPTYIALTIVWAYRLMWGDGGKILWEAIDQ
ncbi:AMP-binding enzyme [Trichoderma harzianum]|uniref:AMP-binding enzyme n=1 Tax=Trichoderma harzianum TaxID=5544 RepID=A0A0G0A6A9_TRIHA|nr:AMP-binding enzyme [Trichoderma harzianum]